MGMAGSLLPSHDSRTLEPVTLAGFTFKIEPIEAIQTYVLMVNGSSTAAHPNGYSLKELVDRIVAYRACHQPKSQAVAYKRAEAQWDYILACGGMAKAKSALEYYLKGDAQ